VNFAKCTAPTAFDLVVAADGIGSKIRDISFRNSYSHVRSLTLTCRTSPFYPAI
jgi:2-polyprenyl-6-methoxyphenol hydroxylase-like FAD-dependent oxidoreductase